jgi:hypothetical protein
VLRVLRYGYAVGVSAEGIIIRGQVHGYKLLANGKSRFTIDVDTEDRVKLAEHFWEQGRPVGVALLNEEVDRQQTLKVNAQKFSPYGEQAKTLKQSGFFRRPDVWIAVGKDAEFLLWLRNKDCAVISLLKEGAMMSACCGDVVAAHVRRIAASAGMARKPEFSAIPLCHEHHTQQHNHSESHFPGGKEWFDQQRIKHVEAWAWETLKKALGFDSWKEVPPRKLYEWAETKELERYLPDCYKL